ncbi:tRNA-splicing endonuclease subunit Sen15 [Trichophaea hybrida]|nr:tRNA-splicing endonuclease subunit Sen15 [Trichophaea hybrida]
MSSTYTPAARLAHTHLQDIVYNHLTNAADWTSVTAHPASSTQPRPLLTGIPPEPVYTDPDVDSNLPPTEAAIKQHEYVLPVDLREKWSLRKMAEVFDAMPEGFWGMDGKGEVRKKRLLMAVVSEDSTVVFYFVHDGLVKPRQN